MVEASHHGLRVYEIDPAQDPRPVAGEPARFQVAAASSLRKTSPEGVVA